MPISPARRAAFEILRRVEDDDAYSSALLAAANDELNSKDRALCHQLVLGVLRQRLWLDRCIEHFGERRIEKLDLPVVIALRLSLYQLRFLTRIPPSAAVNESVNLVRAARLKSAAAFVNAVLRRATREPGYSPAAGSDDPVERVAIETSHPRWLLERWISQLGLDEAVALARANNDAGPLVFRFTAKSAPRAEAILPKLEEGGYTLQRSTVAQNAWRARLTEGETVVSLHQLSQEGLIYFQDEGSQLVAELTGAESGELMLDVCAAPGSKTTLLAAIAPEAVIIAGDLHEHRMRTVKEAAILQHAANILPVVYDATHELPFKRAAFDRVLVDAPCSGTGTLRHNPEIRWKLQPSDIAELSVKQKQILHHAAAMVRPGGLLVYSTCSLEIEENEGVVSHFRENHGEFEAATLSNDGRPVRTFPHLDDVDGFFAAGFRRQL